MSTTTVVWPDGSKHELGGECHTGIPATINGWIETAEAGASPPWYSISTEWPVPSAPANQNGGPNGNLIYTFLGIQDNTPVIFQPILAWGCAEWNFFGCTLGGGYWWIMAAACCFGGNLDFNGGIQVRTGDIIYGSVQLWGYQSCSFGLYLVSVQDETTGSSASIGDCTNSPGGTAGFAGTLEAYNINTCDQLPQSPLHFYSVNSNPAQGSWSPGYFQTSNPSCSFNVHAVSGSDVWLCYNGVYCGYGGGGGCLDQNTPILTGDGYRPVQSLKSGDTVIGYDLTSGQTVTEHVLSNTDSSQDSLVSINDGTLRLTTIDQPVYIRNSTYTGWERQPENLRVGDSMYSVLSQEWVPIYSVQIVHEKATVYDLVTDGPKNFIANGYLLLDK